VYSAVNDTLTPLYTKLTLNLLVYVPVQFIITLKYSTEFKKELLKAKNINKIPYIKKHGISRNSAELSILNFRGIPRNWSPFRIKFRIPRNFKKSLPWTPYSPPYRSPPYSLSPYSSTPFNSPSLHLATLQLATITSRHRYISPPLHLTTITFRNHYISPVLHCKKYYFFKYYIIKME
jgi:hypothetical protein